MRKRFYVDTSVWRDYFEDRSDGVRPLGEFAFQFLKKCEKNESVVLYSEAVISEFERFPEFIKEFQDSFRVSIAIVLVSEKQVAESEAIANKKAVPFGDALHAVLARDNNAMLVSRDRHFEELQEIVECCVPEKVIFD